MLPMGLTVLDLSAYVGLLAVGAVTLNIFLGLLMAFRYSPHRSWPNHRFNYFRFHNWTGYIALALSILHPVILLLNKNPRFLVFDLVYPVHSPAQPIDNTIGAVALYLIAFVVGTSYLRITLGRHLWKSFHFSIYFAAAALFWHSLFTDPSLKLPCGLVRWRQTLRRILSGPCRCRQFVALATCPQESVSCPPNRPADSYV
jgi:predicted ferric reductase